jgi:MATE family multidrug resistance protein
LKGVPTVTPHRREAGRHAIFRLAWPIVLANSAVPLLGLADTAVIGNTGTTVGLGAIALGALVFSFVYWSFGFLRMGTTGFVAQASGSGDEPEVRAAVVRALLLGGGIGVALLVLQRPVAWLALELLGASDEVEALTGAYYDVRIWGAPASLAMFGVMGTFIGLGRTRQVLITQLFLNGLNIGLDVLFAGVLGWGVRGIALGTAIAEWSTFVLAAFLAHRILRAGHADGEAFWPWPRVLDRARAVRTLGANTDIMVRTLFLLMGFAWFTNEGARFGDVVLAANHVLLQLVSMSAYLLDGYAHATEVLVGRAVGTTDRARLDDAVRSATELAAISAAALGALVFLAGPLIVTLLTDLGSVRDSAAIHLPYAAVYVVLSFAAFQLDGIFVGATRTRDMRNASVLSFAAFLVASLWLVPRAGNRGLWIAFVLYVVTRAVTLAARYPALRREMVPAGTSGTSRMSKLSGPPGSV